MGRWMDEWMDGYDGYDGWMDEWMDDVWMVFVSLGPNYATQSQSFNLNGLYSHYLPQQNCKVTQQSKILSEMYKSANKISTIDVIKNT